MLGTPPMRVAAFNRYIAARLNLTKGMFAASGIRLDGRDRRPGSGHGTG
jgi:hypothetical protein